MNYTGIIKVLLIEDDEDDYIITRDIVSEVRGHQFALDWARTFESGLETMCLNQHDVVLVDYRLGARNGVELLREGLERGCQAPVIVLTGAGQHEIDVEAMQAGAADYQVKSELRPDSLERSIRYALQRKRAAALAAFEQGRLAAFGAEVGLLLTRRDVPAAILERCAQAMVQYLNAAAAHILLYDSQKQVFISKAAAGSFLDSELSVAEWPKIRLDIGELQEGKPLLIRQMANDARLLDPQWAKRAGVVSCAGYPLLLEEKLVGLMAVFADRPLTEQICQEMGSVANGISLYIERKRSAEALDASEDKYRSMVENIKEVIFQMDEFGHWTFLNPAWTAVTGFDVQQSLGTFFIEYVHEEDRERDRHIFLQLLEQRLEYCRHETRLLTKNGKVCWVEMYAQPEPKGDGGRPGLSGSLTDITERKLAENAIQKLAAFPQVNPNPVLEFAADGALTYSNDAARQLASSLGQQDLISILPPEPGAIARNCLATGQKALRQEVRIGGRTITWSFFPVAVNQVVHCYGADVTDMLNLEAQFRHAQKLESVGQLAAGVAHDFNNILTVIQGYSDTLLERCPRDSSQLGPLKQISEAARRAAALTRQLLMFSRKQVIQPRVLDLNTVLRNLVNMLLRLLGEDVSLKVQYAAELPCIEADTGMLEQIVMNLAVNSRDAMPKGGNLLIQTEALAITEAHAGQHADARAGEFVCLTVTDTGSGMDEKTLERLFEPFFSTKEVGKGTGLGLATVYGLVKQHQGWIEVTSSLGTGTTFKIYFPVTDRTDALAHPAEAAEPIRGGHETVLVVEDEPVLREMVCEMLKGHGYQVLEASTGVEALKVWDDSEARVDLLLTDMVMPEGMTGAELAEQLRRRKPDLKIICSSGYSPEIMEQNSHNDVAFLPKPYHPPQLARLVRNCLDGRRPSARAAATA
jgi:two-component system, cell cycle sensor histidine kinase and response regulator CckA